MELPLLLYLDSFKRISLSVDDDPIFQVDKKTFMTESFEVKGDRGFVSLQSGPATIFPKSEILDPFGNPICTMGAVSSLSIYLSVNLDLASYGLHYLDLAWADRENRIHARRLYFARILDAAGVLWKSDTVLWVGTARQGILELDLGKDIVSPSDDVLTPVPFDTWLSEVAKLGPTAAPRTLSFLVPFDRISPEMRDLFPFSYEYSGLLDLTEVGPSLTASGGLGTGIRFSDSAGVSVPFQELGEGKLPDKDVSGIALDTKGYLWASTFDVTATEGTGVDGVSVFRPDFSGHTLTWLATFAEGQGILDDHLLDILADSKNILWLPSWMGIYLFDYGSDPVDTSDDRLYLDERFRPGYQIEFISDHEALIAHDGFTYLDFGRTALDPGNPYDETMVSYPQLSRRVASFDSSPGGILAMTSCSHRKIECYALIRSIPVAPHPATPDNSKAGMSFNSPLPCPGISFLRFGPDMRSTDDDEIWRLFDSGGIGCDGVILPPPDTAGDSLESLAR
ncbi:MAG: hypothetical protein HYT87_03540 [Nitrospirae bacterium]|nr:hypothetical protein [Nitrospirota bacterium]